MPLAPMDGGLMRNNSESPAPKVTVTEAAQTESSDPSFLLSVSKLQTELLRLQWMTQKLR
jgi:hypothetical protein